MLGLEKTKEEKIKDKLIDIDSTIESTIDYLLTTKETLLQKFFKDSEFTAQDFCDYMGTKASSVYQLLAFVRDVASIARPETQQEKLPIVEFAEDGTVTKIMIDDVKPIEIEAKPVIDDKIEEDKLIINENI